MKTLLRSLALPLFFFALFSAAVACNSGPEEKKSNGTVTGFGNTECAGVRWNNRSLSYCYNDLAGRLRSTGTSVDFIYYWPSFGADPREIFSDSAMAADVRNWKTKLGTRMPVIVGLSSSPEWLVGDGTADLIATGLPLIETKLAKGKTVRRFLIGRSTGGRNALRLVAKNSSAFSAVAVVCPALMVVDPFNAADVDNYERRHSAYLNKPLFTKLMRFITSVQRNSATWQAHDPLALIAEGGFDHIPIYLSAGTSDSYGFAEGVNVFTSRAYSRGADVRQSLVAGSHCAWDRAGLLAFLNSQIP